MANKHYGWPTSRCYPRTMEDAFKHLGCDPEWFFPPEKQHNWQNTTMLAVAIWMWIGLVYYLVSL